MTEVIWNSAFDLLMENEGGFVNNPKDPGGATKYGVSKKQYPNLDIENLTLEQAKEICKRDYWYKYKCDRLPDALSVALLDFAYMSKPPRPIKFLQKALGVTADGVIGNQTIGAAWSKPLKPVLKEYMDARLDYYRTLPTWKTFGDGWGKRVKKVQNFCEGLI